MVSAVNAMRLNPKHKRKISRASQNAHAHKGMDCRMVADERGTAPEAPLRKYEGSSQAVRNSSGGNRTSREQHL